MVNVLVISTSNSFTFHGMMERIKEEVSASIEFVAANIESIRPKEDWADIFIYNMEKERDDMEEVLMYLRGLCMKIDRNVILIGKKEELAVGEEILSKYLLMGSFLRPLDMTEFLYKVQMSQMTAVSRMEDNRKNRILIVDDDSVYALMVHSWLKDKYYINVVESGTQALKWLTTNETDLILLDYEMPVTSGAKVLEMLRNDEELKDIPVMFLTEKSSKEHVMRVLDLKPEDYILKSILRDDLRDKLDAFFESRGY